MQAFRFSLTGLFGLVTFAAVNFAAVRYSIELWAASVLLLIIAVLLVGVLGMVYRRSGRRAFWSGLTLFGAAYMLLALAPALDSTVGEHLITTKLLRQVHERFNPPRRDVTLDEAITLAIASNAFATHGGRVQAWDAATGRPVRTAAAARASWEDVRRGGHALFALVCCVVGGLLARYFYVTRESVASSK